MPRFFIDTSDDEFCVRDEEGHDYPDLESAKQAAVDVLPDMAREALPDGDRRAFVAVVRGEDGARMVEASLTLEVRRLDPQR